MEEFGGRLEASRTALAGLREAVERREPWPLSDAYGAEPESDWGPKEVLAHVAEMVPYWLVQIDSVLGGPSEPVPFGRAATDPERIGRIGRDRTLPAGELFDQIDEAAADAAARLARLDAAQMARRGIHSVRGEMTVEAMADRFIAGHIEEHVMQLEALLANPPEGSPGATG